MAKDKIQDLRHHLFETIEMLKDGDIEIDKAKAISEVAQVIINSAKVEVQFLKEMGSNRHTGFIQLENKDELS
jgi:hypothetical protein